MVRNANTQIALEHKQIGIEVVEGNLLNPTESCKKYITQASYIVQCASPSIEDEDYITKLFQLHYAVLDLIKQSKSLKRIIFVFCTTYLGVGHDPPGKLIEFADQSPVNPRKLRDGTKYEETIGIIEQSISHLDYAIILFGGVYSMNSWFISKICSQIQRGETVVTHNSNIQWPFTHIIDAVRAVTYLLAINTNALQNGRKFIGSSENPTSVDLVISYIGDYFASRPKLRKMSTEEMIQTQQDSKIIRYFCNNVILTGRSLREVGFQFKFPFLKGGLFHTLFNGY